MATKYDQSSETRPIHKQVRPKCTSNTLPSALEMSGVNPPTCLM